MSSNSVSKGTTKILQKITASIEEGKYYEAHQMLHSVSRRYLKQKKISDAIHLLHNGAKSLLKYNQVGSATDLFKRLIDVYNSESVLVTEESVARVNEILESYKSIDQFSDDALKFANNWSIKFGKCQFGDSSIHHTYGLKCLKEKKYYEAERQLVFGTIESSKALGFMEYQWSTEGYNSDYGYFISRAVLQYLAIKKLSHARSCLSCFCDKIKTNNSDYIAHNTNNVDIYTSSLVNFCQLLILIIERQDSLEQFQKVYEKYKPLLSETDGFLVELLDRIAELFYNIKSEKPHNMFEDIINSLFAPQETTNSIESGYENTLD